MRYYQLATPLQPAALNSVSLQVVVMSPLSIVWTMLYNIYICLCVSSSASSSQAVRCGLFVFAYPPCQFFQIPNPEVVPVLKNEAVGTTPRGSRRCEAVIANHFLPWMCMKPFPSLDVHRFCTHKQTGTWQGLRRRTSFIAPGRKRSSEEEPPSAVFKSADGRLLTVAS